MSRRDLHRPRRDRSRPATCSSSTPPGFATPGCAALVRPAAPAEVLLIHPGDRRHLDRDGHAGQRDAAGQADRAGRRCGRRDARGARRRHAPGPLHRRHAPPRRSRASAGFRCRRTSPANRPPTTSAATRPSTPIAKGASPRRPPACISPTDLLRRARATAAWHVGALDLEVGPGTFRPMEDGDVTAHAMHAERFEIPVALADAVAACRARGGAGLGGRHHGRARAGKRRARRRHRDARATRRPG